MVTDQKVVEPGVWIILAPYCAMQLLNGARHGRSVDAEDLKHASQDYK